MTDPSNIAVQDALKRYLKHSFKAIEHEQQIAADMVDRLEPRTREGLLKRYGDAQAWRGLCSDDVQMAFDLMHALGVALSVEMTPRP